MSTFTQTGFHSSSHSRGVVDEFGWCIDTSYWALPASLWTRAVPEPVANPREVIWNESLAQQLGLNMGKLTPDQRAAFAVGHRWPTAATPLAQAYAGHQFGHLAVLGDGRAVLMGEHLTPAGERVDVQWKGSGRTRYSRRGDGRAALGPMLREYVISEAMHALGVPTSRSLCVALTGDPVLRERALPGAVLTRVAASHLRVGTVQWAAMQNDATVLPRLIEYALWRHPVVDVDSDNAALHLLQAVMHRQIELVVNWARVGFVHGVMNTDNMTLSGETLDYGPCAFIDIYNPKAVFSSIDTHGRYAFDQQAGIAQWNIARLAEALIPAIHPDHELAVQQAVAVLEAFPSLYRQAWLRMMRAKLGWTQAHDDDVPLITEGLACFEALQLDYTATFAHLRLAVNRGIMTADWQWSDMRNAALPAIESAALERAHAWLQAWQSRCMHEAQPDQAKALMASSNPWRIPRNHAVEAALAQAQEGQLQALHDLLDALQKPYEPRHGSDPSALELDASALPPLMAYQTFCGT